MKMKQPAPLNNIHNNINNNINHKDEIHEIIKAVQPLSISQKKSILAEINVLKRTEKIE